GMRPFRIHSEEPMDNRVPLPMDQPTPPAAPVTSPLPAATANTPGPVDVGDLQDKIIDVLQTCYDPEIPVNIYELGLIYNIDVQPTGLVHVRMTLTSPACPAAGSLPPEVRWKVQEIPGVKDAKVEIVWDPPWTKERMSEAARLQLGIFD